ncbi:alkyl hydroperoxide reductase/ Thiol specific antioxidant/ Mal allergen [Geobacter metallireducens RCH3]|uniref:TlpA family-related protein disulfide reductase n=1 Tax=Geobacter metallireducens (strain ATCC 53774 / DSM 7210 / GS-15) TaxID=269799 RepID=Q39VV7_GEOMG|nr:TlpA disulfide reductase family protein [Geobacter metallireducens]ABB31617.1 TlpA family-related protein disulfide reductase [Geobacter metallireducens GS-15]EHP86622.1 alkyl hydroperoxide reductase/ Thiol specific antioxidant/ Mal allergen [Geobacter metallireducens RCH3]
MNQLLRYICACLFTLTVLAVAAPGKAESDAPLVRTGALAPNFKLPTLSGENKSLAQYRGKIVLVNFWASWCPYCRDEMPSMDRLVKSFPKGDLVVLAVNVEKRFPEKYRRAPVSFNFLSDATGQVQQRYGANRLPDTFIVDRKGIIRQRVTGGIEWDAPKVVSYLKSL